MKVPISILRKRMKKVEEKVREENLKALVVYSNGVLGEAGLTHGYLRYLCNLGIRNRESVLILFPEREPILLVPLKSLLMFARETMWFNDIRFAPQQHFGREILSILKPLISDKDRIGYIGIVETPVPVFEPLLKGLKGIEWVEANRIIDELCIVKDEIQMTYHRRAAEICDEMFGTLTREIRKGKKAYQLQADMELTAKYEGCESAYTFLTVGPVADRARYYKEECSRVPQSGDQILASLYIIYEGHWGHAVRTGTLGKPTDSQRRAFDIVLEMQEVALENLKPGLNLNEVLTTSKAVLKKYYPTSENIDGFRLKTAHGIGHHYNDPILSDVFIKDFLDETRPDKKDVEEISSIQIKPNMLFELHPNLWITNEAAAMIGDMVLVTETGNEILTNFPRELILW